MCGLAPLRLLPPLGRGRLLGGLALLCRLAGLGRRLAHLGRRRGSRTRLPGRLPAADWWLRRPAVVVRWLPHDRSPCWPRLNPLTACRMRDPLARKPRAAVVLVAES